MYRNTIIIYHNLTSTQQFFAVGFDIFDLVTNVTVMTTEVGSRALVRIDPIFDERYEEDEEFLTVRIVSVSDGLIDPESQEATVIILDMDCEGTFQ